MKAEVAVVPYAEVLLVVIEDDDDALLCLELGLWCCQYGHMRSLGLFGGQLWEVEK